MNNATTLTGGAGRFQRRLGGVRPKAQCDQEGANSHTPRTDIDDLVTGEGVVDQTPSQRTGRHAQAAGHCQSADDRPHHPQREIFAREYCVKRHDTGVDKPKQDRHGVKRAQLADEGIGQRAERLQQQP